MHRHVVSRDIRKMRYEKDPELKRMYLKRDEFVTANKKMFAQKQDAIFFGMTGMTFDEKMFQNMIVFYKPELKKAMNSKNESNAISRLSKNVRRTLVRNKIINHGWNKKYEITPEARIYLNSKQISEESEE